MPYQFMEDARLMRLLESFVANAPSSSALKIADQFDNPLSDNEVRVFDEILLRMSRIETLSVRAKLARSLSHLSRGPAQTVKELSYDLHSEVASPLLSGSVLALDEDLIAIAHVRSQQHLDAIAKRPHVSIPVTDVVVWRGTWPVLRTLSANRTARLSHGGLLRLVAISQGDGHITVALTKRQDVPPETRKVLLTQFRQMVETRQPPFCGENSGLSLESSRMPAILAPQVSAGDALSDRRLRAAVARVRSLEAQRPLAPVDIADALTRENLAEALAVIAYLAETEIDVLARSVTGTGPTRHHALLIMKAADLPWTLVERVLLDVVRVVTPGADPAPSQISAQRQTYAKLLRRSAQRALKAIHLRSRIRVIEGGMTGGL